MIVRMGATVVGEVQPPEGEDLREGARAAYDLVGVDPAAALAAADSVIAQIPQQRASRDACPGWRALQRAGGGTAGQVSRVQPLLHPF